MGEDEDNADDNTVPVVAREPAAGSRLDLVRARPTAPYRVHARPHALAGGGRFTRRERHRRHRTQRSIEQLIGGLIRVYGLTDAVREQCVHMFWREIVDERIATKTVPDAVSRGVLKVFAQSSAWVHELQFYKAQIIGQINDWIDERRLWLDSSPLVSDIRFTFGVPRARLVDPDHLRGLQQRHLRRLRPRMVVTPPATISESDREAILAETQAVDDEGLRAIIEGLRMKWNR